MHFCSNVDGAHMGEILMGLDPSTCLFIVASKT
jgi:glucose-6-phosphate isomerase